MGELGADPVQLRELASTMRSEGRRIDSSIRRVTGSLRGASWRGRDADRFATRWNEHLRVIHSATVGLDEAAGELEHNADEQLGASQGGSGSLSTVPRHGTAVEGRDPPKDSMTSAPGDPGPPPVGDPLPLRTETWELGGAVAAGLGMKGAARLTVAELPGGTSMVRLEDVDGFTASVGASAELGFDDGAGVELGADAGGELSVHSSDAWYVDSDEVPGLLVRLGVRELFNAGTLSPGLPFASGSLPGALMEKGADLVGLGAPEPTVSDKIISLGGTAGLSAALGTPLLGASGAVAQSIGVRERSDGPSLVVGARAEHSTTAPGGGPSGGSDIEVEIPLEDGDEPRMVITRTTDSPDGEVLERMVAGYDRDELDGHAKDAARAVREADPSGAAEALGAMWQDLDLRAVWSDAVGGVVDDDVHSFDIGAALGLDASASVDAGRRVVTYQR